MNVYIAPEVADVLALHPYLADESFRSLTIPKQIERQAITLKAAHGQGDQRTRMHIMCWWPGAQAETIEEVLASKFSIDDALLTMSREYGFNAWQDVEALADIKPDPNFEMALDLMFEGHLSKLEEVLKRFPSLTQEKSKYGHQSTLLHYIGANGVESHRQQMPLNAPELAELLINKGASRQAIANMYGGGQTPFDLATTSSHPKNAGIAPQLDQILSGK